MILVTVFSFHSSKDPPLTQSEPNVVVPGVSRRGFAPGCRRNSLELGLMAGDTQGVTRGKPEDHNLRPEVNKGTDNWKVAEAYTDNWKVAEAYGELMPAKDELGTSTTTEEVMPNFPYGAGINCGMMVGGQTPIPDFNQSNKDDAEALRKKAEETKALGSSSSAPGDAELVSGVLKM